MSGNQSSTEKQLSEAQRRLKQLCSIFASKYEGRACGEPKSREWEELDSAQSEVLRLERELAKERNEPFAVPCDFPVRWDVGAPMPFVLQSDCRTFLIFFVSEPNPDWDGTEVKVVDPASPLDATLCLVEFNSCASAKLGHPNDEVHRGHPLYGRGLDSYTAQIVKNSPWLREVAKTNSVHECDQPERWERVNHHVFWFHDSTFECLAASYSVEVSREPLAELLSRVQSKLLE